MALYLPIIIWILKINANTITNTKYEEIQWLFECICNVQFYIEIGFSMSAAFKIEKMSTTKVYT